MQHDSPDFPPIFRIDVSADSTDCTGEDADATVFLLRQIAVGQQRQNDLLEELIQQTGAAQRQRASELGQWKESNPDLARSCRVAAEKLSRVQAEFLRNLTDEIHENEEHMLDGEFMLNEFVDRFGPRLAHLNGVLQVLTQLSSIPVAATSPSET